MDNTQINYYQNIYTKFEKLHAKTYFGMRTIFDDFCLMAMASHHNFLYTLGKFPIPAVYKKNYDDLEAEYKAVALKYEKYSEAFPIFHEILADLTLAMKDSPYDYLGKIYMDMNMNSKTHGQFFTPPHICEMMALMTSSNEGLEKEIVQNGYVSVGDFCCGSGAMAIGFIKAVEDEYKISDLDAKVLFKLGDLDLTCVRMAFVNMSILGVSARVDHANALSGEKFASYDTPCLQIALAQGRFQKKSTETTQEMEEKELPQRPEIKMGQLSLF